MIEPGGCSPLHSTPAKIELLRPPIGREQPQEAVEDVGATTTDQCIASCRAFGHCCGGVGGGALDAQCDGRSGRLYFPIQQPPTLSCFMGCTVAAHSADAAACKATCRAAQLSAPDPCSYHLAAANKTFDKCAKCPGDCKVDKWTGQFVGEGECEQACDFTFGCAASVGGVVEAVELA